MTSSVCQGLQSCLAIVEPRVLRLKLAPAKSKLAHKLCDTDSDSSGTKTKFNNQEDNTNDLDTKIPNIVDMGCWNILQDLSNTPQTTKKVIENEEVYVHPLVKNSSSIMLSDKSLEMCTESLGSETGSDISLLSVEKLEYSLSGERSKPRQIRKIYNNGGGRNFPPPLTSISGSNGVQVKPHREGGRLVLKAVKGSFQHTYFHADRREGRLTLQLLRDSEEEEEEDGEVAEEGDEEEDFQVYENGGGGGGGDIGLKGKFQRPSRCMEGGRKGLLNWEPFLVAT